MAMEDTLPRRTVSLVGIQVSLNPVPLVSKLKLDILSHSDQSAVQSWQRKQLLPGSMCDDACQILASWSICGPCCPDRSYVLCIEAIYFACSEVMLPETGVVELCPSRQATAACQRYTPQDIPRSRRLVVPVIPGTTLPYIC
jgi:hypothetical protein